MLDSPWFCSCHATKKPGPDAAALIFTQLGIGGWKQPLPTSVSFPKDGAFQVSSEPGLGLPGTCQELKVVFFLPQEIIFLGTASLGCQSLAFMKAHTCVTVALLLGVLEFSLQILFICCRDFSERHDLNSEACESHHWFGRGERILSVT